MFRTCKLLEVAEKICIAFVLCKLGSPGPPSSRALYRVCFLGGFYLLEKAGNTFYTFFPDSSEVIGGRVYGKKIFLRRENGLLWSKIS